MDNQRTRVKICGLTREADIEAAVTAGADALGFVFYPKSKRCLTVARAAELRRVVPAYVTTVALFVNASPDEIAQVQDGFQPDLLQFHGDESADACAAAGQGYVKAFRVGAPGLNTPQSLQAACEHYQDATGWLFDSYTTQYGGSGQSFDLGLLDALRSSSNARPLILAGGLNAQTVADSAMRSRPWAVDVSSGVELSPGVKSPAAIRAFVAAVRDFDRTQMKVEENSAETAQ